jgi:hypothetical protein
VVRLVIQSEDSRAAALAITHYALQKGGHRSLSTVSSSRECLWCAVALSLLRNDFKYTYCGLVSDLFRSYGRGDLYRADFLYRLAALDGSDALAIHVARVTALEVVPVGHEHLTATQLNHLARGDSLENCRRQWSEGKPLVSAPHSLPSVHRPANTIDR